MRVLLATVLFAGTAFAANIDVPAGDVAALVAAINTANGASGDDVIVLAAGSTYSLTAADNSPNYGPNGLPVVTSTITIQGNGAFTPALLSML
jgi:hypothetical protein